MTSTLGTGAADNAALKLLASLTEAVGISGFEGPVRALVQAGLEGAVDELGTDRMGNLLAIKRSQGPARLRVMLAAHMDEVGFMVTEDRGDDGLRLDKVGGVSADQWLGKHVWLGPAKVPAVVGVKPIHSFGRGVDLDRPRYEDLRIDLGHDVATGEQASVAIGDVGTFATSFWSDGHKIIAKALDDRFGVATLMQLLMEPIGGVDMLGAFTVQEEIGLRGAGPAAFSLDPDMAIVLDCTPARDLPTWAGGQNPDYNVHLGGGPAAYVADSRTVSHPGLVWLARQAAQTAGVPFQIRQPVRGGTDAGAIHRSRRGIPTISISVPARYIHTAAALALIEDWTNTVVLVRQLLVSLGQTGMVAGSA